MAVICITRKLAATGEEVARELAQLGGYRYIERDYIEARLAEYKIGPDILQQYDEKRPGLWASMSENRDRYLHFLKAIIYEETAKGRCVILGRGAWAFLRDVPGVLSIRLMAAHDVRVDRVKLAYACDEKTAEYHIRQSDHNRQGFHRYFFDINWKDASLYDMTLNTGRISPAAAAYAIEELRKTIISSDDETAGSYKLEELRLKTAVMGEIIFGRRLQIQSLAVLVDGAKITLAGYTVSRIVANAAVEAARKVPGVESVIDDLSIVPPAMGS